jgi:hypothetical protein
VFDLSWRIVAKTFGLSYFIRRRDLTDSKSAGLGSVFPSSVVCHRFAHSAIKEPTRFANVSMGDFAHIEEEIDLR